MISLNLPQKWQLPVTVNIICGYCLLLVDLIQAAATAASIPSYNWMQCSQVVLRVNVQSYSRGQLEVLPNDLSPQARRVIHGLNIPTKIQLRRR